MPTINPWDSQNPAEVQKGGTGNSSLTQYSVLVGNALSPVVQIAPGTTGQLLGGNTTNNPAFTQTSNGDFTFTGSTAGATRLLTISQTDNSNTSSNAAAMSQVGGTSGGDPYYRFAIGTARNYVIGPDNSDSDILKINTDTNATSTPSSGTSLWKMTTGGIRTMPLQPYFEAYLTSPVANATGGTGGGGGTGVLYKIIFDGVQADANSNYNNTTGNFTAPVDGKYMFCANVYCSNIGAQLAAKMFFRDDTGAVEYVRWWESLGSLATSTGTLGVSGNVTMSLVAGQTVAVFVQYDGSTQTITVEDGFNATRFSGFLIC